MLGQTSRLSMLLQCRTIWIGNCRRSTRLAVVAFAGAGQLIDTNGSDRCQWELKDTVLAAWRPLTPWARGTVEKPISDCCKVCSIVSWMVYVQTYVQKCNSLSLS